MRIEGSKYTKGDENEENKAKLNILRKIKWVLFDILMNKSKG